MPNRLLTIAGAVLISLFTTSALACACEINCKPGEVYSDEQEMCVEKPTA